MADLINCTIKGMTTEQIASALLTKNAAGEFGIRVVFIDADANDAIDCVNNRLPEEAQHQASIGLSAGGKAALRLALPKGTFLNNVPSYANDAAAAAGGLAVGDHYFNTTTSRQHTRMA